ncbi:DUF4157 domain-containing protein [Paenibacillus sp. GCM10023248]|uniref:eCIS core domain-containing protein n=1 Tax=unclassified Paenibacillus TaxID=185978 RepID=UPI002379710D|nr:DUF4157 domain-containing protein [Paenibacillus sp. MAHUQ-63]MDD9267939.1 DUF4157 domain-containing protein [Paenibacillus sp. MAHUQ-63]
MGLHTYVNKSSSSERSHKQAPAGSTSDRISSFSPNGIAQLQRTIGNRAVAQMFQSQSAPVQRKANNTGMPDHLKTGVESLSGMSMDAVKVHYNSDKPAQVQALAYAQGNNIHVGPGQEEHLPHEAWHVVQQQQGRVRPTGETALGSLNDDQGLESEADEMGAKAADLGGASLQMKAALQTGETDSGSSAGTIQKVDATLFDGLDPDNPSTYDVGGGHSYADHGAHTTEEQQRERLKSGTAPSGRVSKVPPGKAASKFVSDDKHKEAFQTAYSALVSKNAPKKNLVGMGSVIDVAGAGVGYLRDGTEVECDKVQLDIQPSGGKLKVNTMFPVS